MSSEVAIRVDGLSKAYRIRHRRHDHVTLAQSALERVKHPLRRDVVEEFWALRDVSFEIPRGDVVGIIGHNGAGKSTLLKLLTRITPPTEGRIELWGRVGSLLEVGTGFHPELTGRENIYLNGAILGMRRREIDQQFDAIVDFAGVEKFLDTPVKRFSSGMYVRLAFAVAAHLQSEILLLDEVFAVGDRSFLDRATAKLAELALDGRTVLVASHQLSTLRRLCGSAIVLHGGRLRSIGTIDDAIDQYQFADGTGIDQFGAPRDGACWAFDDIRFGDSEFEVGEPIAASVTIRRLRDGGDTVRVGLVISHSEHGVVAHCVPGPDSWSRPAAGTDSVTWEFSMTSPWLKPGTYHVEARLSNDSGLLHSVVLPGVLRVGQSSFGGTPVNGVFSERTAVHPDFTVRTIELSSMT